MKTLQNLFDDQLADMYDAERRIAKALPKMAKAAKCDELKACFVSHLEETLGHIQTLESVFECFDAKVRAKACQATIGLLKEGDEIAAEFKGSPAINAALISAAQKVEHYEMASYGCLHEWAEVLGNSEAASLLKGVLEQEAEANRALNELALRKSNEEALASTSEKEVDDKKAKPKRKLAAA